MEQYKNDSTDPKYISFKSDLRQIYFEFFYLSLLFVLSAIGLAVLYYSKLDPPTSKKYLYSFLGAFIGGLCFDAKWFYRVTARGKFNQYMGWQANKFYWRMIIPFLSAFVGFALYIIVVSKIIPLVVLNDQSNQVAFGFSFIFGYFSDIAIGKISDWINSLTKNDKNAQTNKKIVHPNDSPDEGIIVEQCTICAELTNKPGVITGDYAELVSSGSTILFRKDKMSVIPSVGPLNAFHTLIVSDSHLTSVSQIVKDNSQALFSIINLLTKFHRDRYNVGTIYFEHGSCTATKNDTSCIEHAHLHCVGTNLELLEEIKKIIDLKPIQPNQLALIKSSYLLYIDQGGQWWINSTDSFESQLVRKIFCTQTTKADWNWRTATNVDLISKVISNYQGLG